MVSEHPHFARVRVVPDERQKHTFVCAVPGLFDVSKRVPVNTICEDKGQATATLTAPLRGTSRGRF